MSKLDDILKNRADGIVEIFERAVTGDYKVLIVTESLKTEIKALMLELLGEQDIAALFDNNGGIKRFGRPDATARNDLRNEIRQRIQAL